MDTVALAALLAATLAFGAWLVIREDPTKHSELSASSRPPFGSADGGRADHLPPAGAAPTPTLPAPVDVIGRSARPAPEDQ